MLPARPQFRLTSQCAQLCQDGGTAPSRRTSRQILLLFKNVSGNVTNCPGNCVLWSTVCKETLCCDQAPHPQIPEAAARSGYMEGRGRVEGRGRAWRGGPHATLSWTGSPSELDAAQHSWCKCVSRASCGACEPTPAPSPLRPHSGQPETPRDAMSILVLGWWVVLVSGRGWLPQETCGRHS